MPPKTGEPHEKTVNGKECICCPHHKETCWALKINRRGILHSTGCIALKKQLNSDGVASDLSKAGASTDTTANLSKLTPTKDQMSHARALVTVMESDSRNDASVLTEEEGLPTRG